MFNDSIILGRLFGIRVAVSLSWFGILTLLIVSLGGFYFPSEHPHWPRALHWGLGIATSLLFFLCVLLHELGHSLVAIRNNVPVKSITLFLFGGVSHFGKEAPSAGVEFSIALAGPLTSLTLGLIAAALFLLLHSVSEPMGAVLAWLTIANLFLGFFNLLPGFPLDGGRLLRAMAWFAAEDFRWATLVAARGGQLSAVTMILAGGYLAFSSQQGALASGLWFVLIGGFLFLAANNGSHATLALHALDGFLTRDLMRRSVLTIDAAAPLREVAERFLAEPGRAEVIVERDGALVGMISAGMLRRVNLERMADATVGEVMRPLGPDLLMADDLPAGEALRALFESGNEALPVLAEGDVVGLIRRDDLLRVIELRRRLGR